ncbi:unnamed protein product [Coccothraustes coccothraustes]
MAENVLYADLNLPEPTRARSLTVPDVQGCTYAEVKVKAQDTNAAANCKSSGKSRCSRKHAAILVVVILVLVLAVYLIITYGPRAGSHQDSTTTMPEEALGCLPPWKKHGRKCYFFSPERKVNWNASRAECTAMGSDLVVIDSREELRFLHSQSSQNYYFLGLTYSPEEQKWKWINNVEHDPAMFNLSRQYRDYECTVIGYGNVSTASCGGSETTQNMCEKAATISKRHQQES